MPGMSTDSIDVPIPSHAGLGWAALILGALCIPITAYLGVHSLAVSLPVFGLWFFLPVILLAIVLGIIASRSAHGVAGAALGVAALVLCLTFVIVDRWYGPDVRAQVRAPSVPAGPPIDLQKLLKLSEPPPPATRPAP
jgi:hypothetical protein